MSRLVTILFICLFAVTQMKSQTNSTTTSTFYLIRHAEKVRTNLADKNPDLDQRGYLRAENWKQVLQLIKFDAIYSTNYSRTLKTAKPIAEKQNVQIQLYNPSKINYELFRAENEGKNVLIVGHSNTIPQCVNALIQQEKYLEIDDAEFSHLYIVTIQGNQVNDILLYIDF